MSTNNNDNNDNDFDNGDFWFSTEAFEIKWIILLVIFVVFVLYFLGGYLHAQRRIRKGLPPLRYHRWLLSRAQRAPFEPQQQFQAYAVQQDGYAMHGYPPPPPAYNPNAPPPPSYQRGPDGSKPIPAQNVYEAPPGPPGQSGAGSSSPNMDAEEATQPKPKTGFMSRFKR